MALSRTRFPRGTPVPMLDAIARAPLWAEGIDFGHGTGHGVGYFLNVHEGPQSISKAVPDPQMAMEPGMITSHRARRVPPRPVGRAHREPGAQRAGGHARGRHLRRVPGIRDADAVPDRHALHRSQPAARRRGGLARRLPRHRARAPGAAPGGLALPALAAGGRTTRCDASADGPWASTWAAPRSRRRAARRRGPRASGA
jgi:hypothetical protein